LDVAHMHTWTIQIDRQNAPSNELEIRSEQ